MMTTLQSNEIQADAKLLERNLASLQHRSAKSVDRIRNAPTEIDLELTPTGERNALAGVLNGLSLCSQRRPLAEANKLADSFDPTEAGAVLVVGFGLGHHVAAIADRCKNECVVVVYEPDVALLRAALERIDHSRWLARGNIILATEAADDAFLTSSLRGGEGILAMGVKLVEHPASRKRLGDSSKTFFETFSTVLAAARTNIITTLLQSTTTVENFLDNFQAYVRHPGVADLKNCCKGFPAITVAAGPSLARNVELLKTPGLRDRCVIIAVQTMLKPLLAMGVRPHFVTALDFHAISARFYEGLRPEDVADTTLVVEPKANHAVVRAYPGPIRMPGEQTLDLLLGDELAGEHGHMTQGSTVAHLSYYLARYLGCDPVILIGQDLGFTDGLYYSDGAAIHNVWSGELNPFRTLEMLEWERVARQRRQLRKIPAIDGGVIYTDEQMATYLARFNRDFLDDSASGLHIIDATEGGAAKTNTTVQTLAEAIQQYAPDSAPTLPDLSIPTDPSTNAEHRAAMAQERTQRVRRDVVRMGKLCRQTAQLLTQMMDHLDDESSLNRLIRKSHKLRDEAMSLEPAFELVQRINQLGAFKRCKADRTITLTDDLDSKEIQKRRIERDLVNVEWLADAAEALSKSMDESLRSSPTKKQRQSPSHRIEYAGAIPQSQASRHIAAFVSVDFDRSSLGYARPLDRPIAGRNALQWTLARLARSKRLSRAILVTTDPDRARSLVGEPPTGLDIEFHKLSEHALPNPAIVGARLWSRDSWRGGIANLACHDELIPLGALKELFTSTDVRAGLLVGADWSLIDPAMCDATIDRWLEAPTGNRMTFTQAPPGLCGCVISEDLLNDLADLEFPTLNTVGGLLGYHPYKLGADPIALRTCPTIDPRVRDTRARFIADNPAAVDLMEHLASELEDCDAQTIVDTWRKSDWHSKAPQSVELELCTGHPPHGCAPHWECSHDAPHTVMPTDLAKRILQSLAESRPDAAVTFFGSGDPLTHPAIIELIQFAHDSGIAGVQVRTPLVEPAEVIESLSELPIDVISVELPANTADTYTKIMGADRFRTALENVDALRERQSLVAGLPSLWLVPTITRCDENLPEIEAFYDKWLIVLGAASINPLPTGATTGRIAPLTRPATALDAERSTSLTVRADGGASVGSFHEPGQSIGNLTTADLITLWQNAGA